VHRWHITPPAGWLNDAVASSAIGAWQDAHESSAGAKPNSDTIRHAPASAASMLAFAGLSPIVSSVATSASYRSA
jgi:hypothetical protein